MLKFIYYKIIIDIGNSPVCILHHPKTHNRQDILLLHFPLIPPLPLIYHRLSLGFAIQIERTFNILTTKEHNLFLFIS